MELADDQCVIYDADDGSFEFVNMNCPGSGKMSRQWFFLGRLVGVH